MSCPISSSFKTPNCCTLFLAVYFSRSFLAFFRFVLASFCVFRAGFGFGFITAYINEECIKQETTKLAIARGRDDTGQEIFCTMEHAKNTTECRELQSKLAKREPTFISVKEEKTGLFGTTWDDTTKQWVFNTTR